MDYDQLRSEMDISQARIDATGEDLDGLYSQKAKLQDRIETLEALRESDVARLQNLGSHFPTEAKAVEAPMNNGCDSPPIMGSGVRGPY